MGGGGTEEEKVMSYFNVKVFKGQEAKPGRVG